MPADNPAARGAKRDPGLVGLEGDYGVTEVRWSHLIVMFLICFACHGEVFRSRPTDAQYLNEFYLCLSFGECAAACSSHSSPRTSSPTLTIGAGSARRRLPDLLRTTSPAPEAGRSSS